MPATLHAERDGRVLTVRLDHPPHNFMDAAMVSELDDLTRSVERDRSIGAIVLTGAPQNVFITHFDIGEISAGVEAAGMRVSPAVAGASLRAVGTLTRLRPLKRIVASSPAAGLADLLKTHDMQRRLERMDKVVIAQINGTALGAGFELALACDLRLLAAGDHRIGSPEVTLGVLPGGGGTQRLVRLIGPGRALEAVLEARTFSPDEALAMGLVHRVVPASELEAQARGTAERLARRSPEAVRAIKRAIYEGGSLPLDAGLHVERAGFLSISGTDGARRALAEYAAAVQRGEAPAWADEPALERWREGTVVDTRG